MKNINKNVLIAFIGGVLMVGVVVSTLDGTKGTIMGLGLGVMLYGIFAEINSLKEKK